jgi:hypothetical protein
MSATCLNLVASELRPLGDFTCSQLHFTEVVSAEVDHHPDPMVIMYCPDLMVLIHLAFRTSGNSTSLVPNSSEVRFPEV